MANYAGNDVSVLLGNGDGTFKEPVHYVAGDGPRSVAMGDLDGDGAPELAVASYITDSVAVFINRPGTCPDLDEDGYGDPASLFCTHGELDCDDSNPDVNPGMPEIPGNGIDDDCDPTTPAYPEPANTIAASYGARSLLESGLVNAFLILLVPAGVGIALRSIRRRK